MEEKVKNLTDGGNSEFTDSISEALKEFNRWHGREAIATLIKLEDSSVVAELSGPFCRSCGIYDYFDDLKLELEKVLDKQLEITGIDGGDVDGYLV
ncbi:MAG: hypothetical protein ACK4GQ_02875, partial [Candidatus Hadarchaeales archaeon]